MIKSNTLLIHVKNYNIEWKIPYTNMVANIHVWDKVYSYKILVVSPIFLQIIFHVLVYNCIYKQLRILRTFMNMDFSRYFFLIHDFCEHLWCPYNYGRLLANNLHLLFFYFLIPYIYTYYLYIFCLLEFFLYSLSLPLLIIPLFFFIFYYIKKNPY